MCSTIRQKPWGYSSHAALVKSAESALTKTEDVSTFKSRNEKIGLIGASQRLFDNTGKVMQITAKNFMTGPVRKPGTT